MREYYFSILILLIFLAFRLNAQSPTLGLLYHDNLVSDGYVLFTPETNEEVYLINNCGEVVNQWTFLEFPAATCYLLENGTLLRAGKNTLELRDWDNTLLWRYEMDVNGLKQHHDIEPLPNGNILCVLTDVYQDTVMIAAGRNPLNIDPTFRLDRIVELQPIGADSAVVVWKWKFMDHFIQDFDSTKANYGIVENHPELIDINFDNGEIFDWTHVNAVDYNAALDQILITARHLSELYIIDHSTTTIEASGHSGGNSNKGGDFLWRWGNTQVYRQGGLVDQKLFLPHDGKWVEPGYLDENKITAFNNNGDGTATFSSIHVITPEIIGGVYQEDSDVFMPLDYEWSWNGSILGTTMCESKKSGTHALPNGNFMICESSLGQISEITKNGDHLWTYKNPHGTSLYNQFDVIPIPVNAIFRGEKYPSNYIGLLGQDLTSQGIIEDQNTNSDTCLMSVNIENQSQSSISIVNPLVNGVLNFNQDVELEEISIRDINGRLVYSHQQFIGNRIQINLNSGMYFVQLRERGKIYVEKLIVP